MPNIASLLKSEIGRVARKEVRGETQSLKKSSAQYRADLASLKRRVADLEKLLTRLSKLTPAPESAPKAVAAAEKTEKQFNFSSGWFSAQRKRLDLTADEMGVLLNASSQSVLKWENGTRPRAKYLPAIAALKTLGKRRAAAILASLAS